MLRPLQAVGIYPEVTCVLDPSAIIALHFAHATTLGHLCYAAGVNKSIVEEWTGPKTLIEPVFGSSVLHMAIGLTYAEVIHLVGADFCYVGRQSHATGVVTRYDVGRKHCTTEVNGYGETVLTDRDLLHYRRELEAWILSTGPSVRVIKHGRGGLPVVGAEWADD